MKVSCCSLPRLPTNISIRLTALGGNPGQYGGWWLSYTVGGGAGVRVGVGVCVSGEG